MTFGPTRRDVLGSAAMLLTAGTLPARGDDRAKFRLATFSADVTPPVGHPCMGGGIQPVKEVVDPLFCKGLALMGPDKPLVLAAVDWCEIRNEAFDRWRTGLAEAVGTTPDRVLVGSLHQHDAPVADLEAERILIAAKAKGSVCMPDFHEKAVRAVAAAAKESLKSAQPISHYGTGEAKVEQVASNRRWIDEAGKPHHSRMSATRDADIRGRPEGTIDPFVKTLSFWNGGQPVAAVSCYAVHPMSFYGRGGVSADFVGAARKLRQADDPKVFQMYVSGCSGNVVAGKYNDGNPLNRPVLAERLHRAMLLAWEATKRRPLESIGFRSVPLRLEPRNDPAFTVEGLTRKLTTDARPFGQCLAAMGLAWRKRADAGHKLDVPVLDFGGAHLLLLPGESYVEYQLLAQKLRPDSFVVTVGYGECATGYVPIERAFEERDGNLSDWCWVAPGSEKAMTAAIQAALAK